MTDDYNGWANRETWAVALHIDNDESLLEIALDYAREEIEGHREALQIDADFPAINSYYLGQTLQGWIENDLLTLENIAGNQPLWLMLTDIGSLYRVDWRELADHYLATAQEVSI